MNRAVTQVNVSSPVILNVADVDAVHFGGRQQGCRRFWQGDIRSAGVLVNGTVQDGCNVNLGDPWNSSVMSSPEYVETSQQRRGSTEDSMEVGLTHSTRSAGKPRTGERGQKPGAMVLEPVCTALGGRKCRR